MASSVPNKFLTARAAAILTTGEVAALSLDLNELVPSSNIVIDPAFTLGSLTNVILKAYVSMDGSTWQQIREGAGATQYSVTLTASSTDAWSIKVPSGYKYFRMTATGTGTVTSSSLALTYRYVRRGTM